MNNIVQFNKQKEGYFDIGESNPVFGVPTETGLVYYLNTSQKAPFTRTLRMREGKRVKTDDKKYLEDLRILNVYNLENLPKKPNDMTYLRFKGNGFSIDTYTKLREDNRR